ncbi:MAG: hypothetical protein MJY94_04130 [Bacteroidales bacterium]|nr:hypothetical protein [Bacteroidales bacterium]
MSCLKKLTLFVFLALGIQLANAQQGSTGKIGDHDYVELAGLCWATSNIGAESMTESGSYYDITDSSSKTAVSSWGSEWRLPSKTDFEALMHDDNCIWKWTKIDEVYGYKVSDRRDPDAYIFFPATGIVYPEGARPGSGGLSKKGSYGYYWTSDKQSDIPSFVTMDQGQKIFGISKGSKCTIRLVSEKTNQKSAQGGSQTKSKYYEPVDLGLSVKWCNMNVGADYPEQYGYYFCWGQVSPVNLNRLWGFDSYLMELGSKRSTLGESDCGKEDDRLSRYVSGGMLEGFPLPQSYDMATAHLGEDWRLPTKSEMEELLENCTYKMTIQKNVYGCLLTSKINGNSIFIPAGGSGVSHEEQHKGKTAFLWSSMSLSKYPQTADYLTLSESGPLFRYNLRILKLNVRAVYNEQEEENEEWDEESEEDKLARFGQFEEWEEESEEE